jgi:hypothetical protein
VIVVNAVFRIVKSGDVLRYRASLGTVSIRAGLPKDAIHRRYEGTRPLELLVMIEVVGGLAAVWVPGDRSMKPTTPLGAYCA